jgi:hypothetical protein
MADYARFIESYHLEEEGASTFQMSVEGALLYITVCMAPTPGIE